MLSDKHLFSSGRKVTRRLSLAEVCSGYDQMVGWFFFFDKTSCLYLCKEYIDGYSTDTGTIWKDTEGQLSYTFCTKAPTEKRKYNNALGNFCTCPASSPSPTSSAAAVQSTSFRRKRLQLQDQRKPHRPEALKRAATERTQEGTSAGDAPRTSLATDPNLTPVNRTAKTRIRPPHHHKPEICPTATIHRHPNHT